MSKLEITLILLNVGYLIMFTMIGIYIHTQGKITSIHTDVINTLIKTSTKLSKTVDILRLKQKRINKSRKKENDLS